MKIDGIELPEHCLSEWDKLPVKNHLPEELKNRFKTENQWLEAGFELNENATSIAMHPSWLNKKLCMYYSEKDVKKLNVTSEICVNCIFFKTERRAAGNCIVAGCFVSPSHHCSEWQKSPST